MNDLRERLEQLRSDSLRQLTHGVDSGLLEMFAHTTFALGAIADQSAPPVAGRVIATDDNEKLTVTMYLPPRDQGDHGGIFSVEIAPADALLLAEALLAAARRHLRRQP